MIKEYWLLKKIKTSGHKNPLQVVDILSSSGIREAERDFKIRNNFKKLLEKSDLIICISERFY